MKDQTLSSLKFDHLQVVLGLKKWKAVGLLESLWLLTKISAPDGDIGRFTNDQIAAWMQYSDHPPDEMIAGLVQCGFLDEDPEGFRLVVHDWSEHATSGLQGAYKSHQKKFADQILKEKNGQVIVAPLETRPEEDVRTAVLKRDGGKCQYCGKAAETIDHLLPQYRGGGHEEENLAASCWACNGKKGTLTLDEFARQPFCPPAFSKAVANGTVPERMLVKMGGNLPPNYLQVATNLPPTCQQVPTNLPPPTGTHGAGVPTPHHTTPNHTSPHHTTPSGSVRDSVGALSPDMAVVKRLGNRMLRNPRIEKTMSNVEIWEVCWVAAVLDETVVSDLVTAVAGGKVKSPKRYVLGAMRKLCESHGRNWLEMVSRVGSAPGTSKVSRLRT